MGVSVGLTGGAIMSKGSLAQKKKYGRELLTLEKVGAWAITEPSSGSDAFGAMKSTARRDGEGGYILNGSKTFITNGPFADIIVFICRLDEPGIEPRDRKIVSFILDSGMPGLEQSAAFKKMGDWLLTHGRTFFVRCKSGSGTPDGGIGRWLRSLRRKIYLQLGALRCCRYGAGISPALTRTIAGIRQNPRAVRSTDWQLPTHSVEIGKNGSCPSEP